MTLILKRFDSKTFESLMIRAIKRKFSILIRKIFHPFPLNSLFMSSLSHIMLALSLEYNAFVRHIHKPKRIPTRL